MKPTIQPNDSRSAAEDISQAVKRAIEEAIDVLDRTIDVVEYIERAQKNA